MYFKTLQETCHSQSWHDTTPNHASSHSSTCIQTRDIASVKDLTINADLCRTHVAYQRMSDPQLVVNKQHQTFQHSTTHRCNHQITSIISTLLVQLSIFIKPIHFSCPPRILLCSPMYCKGWILMKTPITAYHTTRGKSWSHAYNSYNCSNWFLQRLLLLLITKSNIIDASTMCTSTLYCY